MKKTYLQPTLQVLRLNTHQFIAASPIKQEGNNAVVDLDNEEYNGNFNSRRNGNVWEDEEEED